LRFSRNQADLKILALFRKTGGFRKYWCFYKNQADDRILAAVEIPAPGEKISGTGKYWQPAYCLGSAESPAADFLLDWLKSSRSDPPRCVASLSGCPAFMGGLSPILYRPDMSKL
jgi:hypothetical protein